MLPQFNSLKALFDAFPDDATALAHFEAIHWKHGAFCPHCKGTRVMHFSNGKTHKCSACRKKFSIRTGTIFEDTKLGMHVWFAAIWLLLNRPKGIASTQLAVDLNITQKSAWFVLHRLRYASRTRSFARPLAGEVEADTTFVGGKPHNMHKAKREKLGDSRKQAGKTIVHGMLSRATETEVSQLRAETVPDAGGRALQSSVRANVEPGSTLYTDAWRSYRKLKREYDHQWIDHGITYVDGRAHTNGIEGVWSLFKRQYHGTHHWISAEHMDAYLAEMCYRFNRRAMHKSLRVDDLLGRVSGRLTYRALISHGEETAHA